MRPYTAIATVALTFLLVLAACGDRSDDHGQAHQQATSQAVATAVTSYPLDVCLVMEGTKLDAMGEPVVLVHNGQEWKFCCRGCIASFEGDPESWQQRLVVAKTEVEPKSHQQQVVPKPRRHEAPACH